MYFETATISWILQQITKKSQSLTWTLCAAQNHSPYSIEIIFSFNNRYYVNKKVDKHIIT